MVKSSSWHRAFSGLHSGTLPCPVRDIVHDVCVRDELWKGLLPLLPATPDVDRPSTFQARFSDRAVRCARAFGLGEVGFRGLRDTKLANAGSSATVRVTTIVFVARLFHTSMASISLRPGGAYAEIRKSPLLDTGTALPSNRSSAISLSPMTRPAISYSPVEVPSVAGTAITRPRRVPADLRRGPRRRGFFSRLGRLRGRRRPRHPTQYFPHSAAA